MDLRESQKDIDALDQALEAIFEGMKIIPGTVCRIAAKYLGNWGIKVTDANRGYIETRGFESSLEDWEAGTPETHDAIDRAIASAGLESGNKDMNRFLAGMVVPIIRNMLEANPGWKHFKILDTGAGDGDTTIALLDVLAAREETEALADRCHFYLLEPSWRRVAEIGRRLEEHRLRPQYTIAVATFEDYLWSIKDGNFDMAIANAVFHHMTTPAYLSRLYDKLTEQGVLAVGDWYGPIWSHPAFLLPVFSGVQGGEAKAAAFRKLFGLGEGACEAEEGKLTEDERLANKHVRTYVGYLGEELDRIDARSRTRMMEAMQPLWHNLEDVKGAGFETNIAELAAKHRGFVKMITNVRRLFPSCNLASVWAAGKIRR